MLLRWDAAIEPETAVPPEAMETFLVCVLAALPCAMLPMAPVALDTFGAWLLAADPLMAIPPLAELALGCCASTPLPAIETAPDADEALAD
jgi:hypothetical protein